MKTKIEEVFGPNSALVEDLYSQYRRSPNSIPDHWKKYFEKIVSDDPDVKEEVAYSNAAKNGVVDVESKAVDKTFVPMDMAPPSVIKRSNVEKANFCTLKFNIPARLIIQNRYIINDFLAQNNLQSVPYMALITWGILTVYKTFPQFQEELSTVDNIHSKETLPIHLALDMDIAKSHEDVVNIPQIINAEKLSFKEYWKNYQDIANMYIGGHITPSDYKATMLLIDSKDIDDDIFEKYQNLPDIVVNINISEMSNESYLSRGGLSYKSASINSIIPAHITYDTNKVNQREVESFISAVQRLFHSQKSFYESIYNGFDIPLSPLLSYESGNSVTQSSKYISIEKHRYTTGVMELIQLYRTRGHVLSDINPLKSISLEEHPEFNLENFGLNFWHLNKEVYCGNFADGKKAPLKVILNKLKRVYASRYGIEYMHVLNLEEKQWIREHIESENLLTPLSEDERLSVFRNLVLAVAFEKFLHKKYLGHKRFSLEGAETIIPMMYFLIKSAAEGGIKDIVLGMAHRGRLNILSNILGLPMNRVFSDFSGSLDIIHMTGSGDVKYHLGINHVYKDDRGNKMNIKLLPNPSHLEAVCPVVEGSARAMQDHASDDHSEKYILPLLIHGDAAFAGQGTVAETLNMSQLRGYKAGGTVHIIINNQIGFTTLPIDGHSTKQSSDLAKMILAPIYRINGNDPEVAVKVVKNALDYRQRFGKDVVIDMVCYRRYGHNEGDEPGFTQPDMYKQIHSLKSVDNIYENELKEIWSAEPEKIEKLGSIRKEIKDHITTEHKNSNEQKKQSIKVSLEDVEPMEDSWEKLPDTSFDMEKLKAISIKLNTVPHDFDANPKLLKLLARRAMITEKNERKIDWGYAEALAVASLLSEGYSVRISGQDVQRGTFAHRHAVLHGTQKSNDEYIPLNFISDHQGKFYIYNSLLSEFAVLGFEFGYSATKPDSLVIWEAQFGDFANGAQVIIDQFITSSEDKWGQKVPLVITLPHGFEGQGPEHSSARLERFLQSCAEQNMQVVNLTTPVQYYHALRKQIYQKNKRPLIIMSPKSLLRHPYAMCSIENLAYGSFHYFLEDSHDIDKEKITTLLLCSGKIFYDLDSYRSQHKLQHAAIGRVEQLYPYPEMSIGKFIDKYPSAKRVLWVQEEPSNMGAWWYMMIRLKKQLPSHITLEYCGRSASASPATGQFKVHLAEQQDIVKTALSV